MDESQFHPEGGALTRITTDADLTAHEFHKMMRDGEAQSRAAVTPAGGAVRLIEGLEQLGLDIHRDANASIVDFEAQLLVSGESDACDGKGDAAFVGELDGIAKQIGKDLAQLAGIAHQAVWNLWRNEGTKIETLDPGSPTEETQNFFYRIPQAERHRFDQDLSGLDLGEIQDVIKDVQQVVRGMVNNLRVVPLLGRQA